MVRGRGTRLKWETFVGGGEQQRSHPLTLILGLGQTRQMDDRKDMSQSGNLYSPERKGGDLKPCIPRGNLRSGHETMAGASNAGSVYGEKSKKE